MLVLVSTSTADIIEKLPHPLKGMPLEIYYSYGDCHAERGVTNILIDAKGNGLYERGSGFPMFEDGQRFEQEDFRMRFILNETELLGLLDGLEKCGFYSLNDSYFNPDVSDGSCRFISITKNNVTKSVGVSNSKVPEAYNKAAVLIEGMAQNKTHLNSYDSRAVDPLIQALTGKDSDVRRDAARALGRINDTQAVEPVSKDVSKSTATSTTPGFEATFAAAGVLAVTFIALRRRC